MEAYELTRAARAIGEFVVDDLSTGDPRNVGHLTDGPGFELVHADVTDRIAVAGAILTYLNQEGLANLGSWLDTETPLDFEDPMLERDYEVELGRRWRDEQEWPLARTRSTAYHFHGCGLLSHCHEVHPYTLDLSRCLLGRLAEREAIEEAARGFLHGRFPQTR